MMKATTWQRLRRTVGRRRQVAAFLAASTMLAQCSAVPRDDATPAAPPQNYGALVANTLKTFKGFADYSDFQISSPRWVHTMTGWNWLTCVRYADHGRQRFYSFFISGNAVANGRYDVRTDRCGAQQYAPLNLTSGAIEAPATSPQPAPGAAPAITQGSIY